MQQELERVVVISEADVSELDHVVCEICYPNIVDAEFAMCGTDVSRMHYARFDEPSCVVCHDLEFSPCPKCGG